jgi:hypothetical protein
MGKQVAVVALGLLAALPADADPRIANKGTATAPANIVGVYERVPGEPAKELTEDKSSSCRDPARSFIQKTADGVSRVAVSANSITINNGKSNGITFATSDAVISNVVIDRDDRWTTALRLMVLPSGALVITYNKVERETADWCSDTWGVMIKRK